MVKIGARDKLFSALDIRDMDELPITAEERKLAQEAALAVAAIGTDYAPFGSAAEKKEYALRLWAQIYGWATSTDVSEALTKQDSVTLDIDPVLVGADVVEAWQKTLSEKGFITEIGWGAVTVRLPD
jgi:hypothetical protein